jgi:hypothetical protein
LKVATSVSDDTLSPVRHRAGRKLDETSRAERQKRQSDVLEQEVLVDAVSLTEDLRDPADTE